jgi:hypothetical protein
MTTTTTTRPTSCLATTATVRNTLAGLTFAGCEVDGSISAGHLSVYDDLTLVYRALQKGKGQPWIVSAYNSERITWK